MNQNTGLQTARWCPDFIVFDCDGVIFDSNRQKDSAFRAVLASYPAHAVETFIAYHRQNGGVSRYVKLKYFIETLIKKPQDCKTLLPFLLDRYASKCRQLYASAPLTPCCNEVLRRLYRQARLYVASGSDEAELRGVFQERSLADMFAAIFGSPKSKRACIDEILAREGSTRGMLVGDASSDREAAAHGNLDFIFMSCFSQDEKLLALARGDPTLRHINTLCALEDHLKSMETR